MTELGKRLAKASVSGNHDRFLRLLKVELDRGDRLIKRYISSELNKIINQPNT